MHSRAFRKTTTDASRSLYFLVGRETPKLIIDLTHLSDLYVRYTYHLHYTVRV
jgi:hypothetical protein